MIKVIEGYKMKKGVEIPPLLLKLRSHAMQYQGFVGAENLISEEESSIVAMVSTWEKTGHWRIWESSKIRQELLQQIETLLAEQPRVTIYRIMPTISWMV